MRRLSGVLAGADEVRSEAADGSVKVVDVRRADEYARGHVPGAVSMPLSSLLADDGPAAAARLFGSVGIGDEDRVAVYDDTFGALASRAAWTLEYIGHRGSVSLLGVTYGGWLSSGLDVEKGGGGTVATARAEHSASPRESMAATAAHVEASLGEEGGEGRTIILDNRERLNYLEQHIPGAVSMPYRMLGSPGGAVLKPAALVRRLFENRGVSAGREVVTYCGSVGTLSGLAYYALREAGIGPARLYVRSFREWKELGKPVERQADANYWDLSAE